MDASTTFVATMLALAALGISSGWWIARSIQYYGNYQSPVRPVVSILTMLSICFGLYFLHPRGSAPGLWPYFSGFAFLLVSARIAIEDLDTKRVYQPWALELGALFGILVAYLQPETLLPVPSQAGGLIFSYPGERTLGIATPAYAVAAGALFAFWVLANLSPYFHESRGMLLGFRIYLRRLRRNVVGNYPAWLYYALGCALIYVAWNEGGQRWLAVFTAITGLAAGLAGSWLFRICARWGAGREALGFADVLYFGMAGVFLGWQSIPFVLILALPFACLQGLGSYLLFRSNELPFLPALCGGAAGIYLGWSLVEPAVSMCAELLLFLGVWPIVVIFFVISAALMKFVMSCSTAMQRE